MIDNAWYVAQSQGGLEATAIHHLSRDGLLALAPCVTDKRRRYFPGYVFVRLRTLADCFVVNRTPGIVKLLPLHAHEPAPLPDGWVEDLMGRITRGELDERGEETFLRRYLPGETVAALVGPMAGRPGQFTRYHKGSAVLLGHLLGKAFEYRVPEAQLIAPASVEPELSC